MNKFFTFLLALSTAFSFATAQEAVTITTGVGYETDVYYSLADGERGTTDLTDWDIAFSTNLTSGVRVNVAGGATVWVAFEAPADFATIDTTGQLTFANQLFNSNSDWLTGALNNARDTSEFSDVGWGDYDIQTHEITASRVFIVEAINGTFYKFMVDERSKGVYRYTYAELDGSNEVSDSIVTADYPGKNFVYLSLGGSAFDREPADPWDLLFTKVTEVFPGGQSRGVSTIMSNVDVEVAVVTEVTDTATFEDYSSASFSSDANTFGRDWRDLDENFEFFILDSMVYFVRTPGAEYYKVLFTNFSGSMAGGVIGFTKQLLETVSRPEASSAVLGIYPNPASDHVNLMLDGISGQANVMITDLSGRVVQRNTLNVNGFSANRLDVSALNTGLYIVSLEASGQRLTQRLSIR